MATLVHDTHRAVLRLQQTKFSAEQAQGIVDTIENIDISHLATKDDIKDLRIEMYGIKLDLYKALAAQTIVILGVVIALFQFIK